MHHVCMWSKIASTEIIKNLKENISIKSNKCNIWYKNHIDKIPSVFVSINKIQLYNYKKH